MKKEGVSVLIALGKPVKKKRLSKPRAMKKKVVKHLRGDIKDFKKEIVEDRDIIKDIKAHYDSRPGKMKKSKGKEKFEDVMHEYKEGELKSGSKKGPVVKEKKQALAIAFSEMRKKNRKKRK